MKSDFFVTVYERPAPQVKDIYFTNESFETEYNLKTDFSFLPTKNLQVDFGASYKRIGFDYNVHAEPDTLFLYDLLTSVRKDSIIGIFRTYPAYRVDRTVSSSKNAAYAQLSYDVARPLRVTAGLRYDYFAFNNFQSVSPRIGMSYFVHPRATLNLAYGKHYQSPAFTELAANPVNRNLRNKYNDQVVLGLEYLLRDDIKLVLELYQKEYHDVPITQTLTTLDPYDFDDGTYVNLGAGQSRGFELFLQKKLTRHFSSILSYSHSVATNRDPRFNVDFDGDYDYRDVFTLITGYKYDMRAKSWYRALREKRWTAAFSWLPIWPADEVELSFKFRYLGGRPYTPPAYFPQLREWVVTEQQQLNGERYPAYHRFDFRIDRRFIFNSWNLVVFFDLVNIYNRDNIWSYQYNDDGTIEKVLQYKTLPVGGVSLEF